MPPNSSHFSLKANAVRSKDQFPQMADFVRRELPRWKFNRFGSVHTIRFAGPPMTVLLGSPCLAFPLARRPSFSRRDKCTTKQLGSPCLAFPQPEG